MESINWFVEWFGKLVDALGILFLWCVLAGFVLWRFFYAMRYIVGAGLGVGWVLGAMMVAALLLTAISVPLLRAWKHVEAVWVEKPSTQLDTWIGALLGFGGGLLVGWVLITALLTSVKITPKEMTKMDWGCLLAFFVPPLLICCCLFLFLFKVGGEEWKVGAVAGVVGGIAILFLLAKEKKK